MRYLLTFALLLGVSAASLAVESGSVNRSSYVAGTTSAGCIQARYLDKVVVGEPTTGGNLSLFNSTWTYVLPVSSVSLATVNSYDFANTQIKGICYLADTPTNGVTILYKN